VGCDVLTGFGVSDGEAVTEAVTVEVVVAVAVAVAVDVYAKVAVCTGPGPASPPTLKVKVPTRIASSTSGTPKNQYEPPGGRRPRAALSKFRIANSPEVTAVRRARPAEHVSHTSIWASALAYCSSVS
jgi:hypothetical protein